MAKFRAYVRTLGFVNIRVYTKCFTSAQSHIHNLFPRQYYVKKGIDEDTAVSLYYERLAAVQARGEQSTHQVLRDIFKEVCFSRTRVQMLLQW